MRHESWTITFPKDHCTGMVAKFLFVSKCPGIGAALNVIVQDSRRIVQE